MDKVGESGITTPAEVPKKRRRKRTKGIIKAVKEQMEFYFSDANLSKDRFLSHLIQDTNDGFVDLEVFKTFNKIKSLTVESNLIAKALADSTILELDHGNQKVRRKTEIIEPEGVKEKTIYVEHLPATANHDWIKKLFSAYGEISYISLPRFQRSGTLKGFAFVEFKCVTAALKACEHFGASSSELKEYIASFDLANAEESENQKQDDNVKIIESDSCATKEPGKLKRSHPESSDTEENVPPDKAKKTKLLSNETENITKTKECDSPGDGTEKSALSNNATEITQSESEANPSSPACAIERKSKRKRRKRSKQNIVVNELDTISLRVMSKLEWISWRKKYLQIQKATMREIKKSLSLFDFKGVNLPSEKTTPATSVEDKENEKLTPMPFVSDVILKVLLKNPLTEVKAFKNELKKIVDVAFVDVSLLDPVIHIRCHNKEHAKTLLEQKGSIPDAQEVHLLQGDEEKHYWEKITADREEKFSNKKKSNRMRGFQRIVLKAEKAAQHIRFDEGGNVITAQADTS